MRKLFLFIAALTLSVGLWAQEINAVKFVQGATTDWYLLSTNPEVTMGTSITIAGKSYDLTQGEVETIFAYKDPTPTSLIEANQSSNVVKFIRDGQLYILRDDKTFNAQGMRLNGTESLQVTENR